MKTLGFSLTGLGALLVLVAFGYDTAPEGTHNMGLLQTQMMILAVACLLSLAGVILATIASVLTRMEIAGLLPPAGVRPVASMIEDRREA